MGGRQILWRSLISRNTGLMASSSSSSRIFEGVFAIHKPPSITSAQVIRDVQHAFQDSSLFRPWFDRERARRNAEPHNQRNKRRRLKKQQQQLKLGHGGTLDPLATGVLILGAGTGTKSLSRFLECTKSYDAVVLFGTATDTYDVVGKVVGRKAFDHVTKGSVEEALEKFRGDIMQRPPIFSALRVQGKRLYEYAREGKEVPVEIQERPVTVESLELVEWMEPESHEFHWPTEEAEKDEKEVVEKVLHLNGENCATAPEEQSQEANDGTGLGNKRKEQADDAPNGTVQPPGPPTPKRQKVSLDGVASGGLPGISTSPPTENLPSTDRPASPTPSPPTSRAPCPAPAARLRMTVTSGFYVRSLCHDLGAAVGSLGVMASLVRTRQGDFRLGENVLEYEDLGKGEEVWGDKVMGMLEEWGRKEAEGWGGGGLADEGEVKKKVVRAAGAKSVSGERQAVESRANSSSEEAVT